MEIVARSALTAAHGERRERPLRPRCAEDQQSNPGDEAVRRPQLGVRDGVHDIPSDAGHRADDAERVRQVHVRVQRHRGRRVLPGRDEVVDRGGDLVQLGVGQLPGGSAPRTRSASRHAVRPAPRQTLLQDSLGDLPPLQPAEVDRDGVLEVPGPAAEPHVEPLTQERPHGMTEEPLELIQPDGAEDRRVERAVEERRRVVAGGEGGAGPGQVEHVETPWPVRHELVAFEVPLVEGLEWVLQHDGVAHTAGRAPHRVFDHVEQFPDRNGGWPTEIGALVATRVRHHEVIPCRQQRVQQELTVLAAHVTVTHALVARRQVVTVPLNVPGEAAVVQPEEAHHPVRDGAHGHECADGEVAGAEVRPRGPTLEALGEDGADVVATQGDRARRGLLRCLDHQLVEEPRELRPLPRIARRRRHQGVGDPRQGVGPLRHGARAGQRIEAGS